MFSSLYNFNPCFLYLTAAPKRNADPGSSSGTGSEPDDAPSPSKVKKPNPNDKKKRPPKGATLKAITQSAKSNAKNAPIDQKNTKATGKAAVPKKVQASEKQPSQSKKAAPKQVDNNDSDSGEDEPAQKEDLNSNQTDKKSKWILSLSSIFSVISC